MARAYNPTPTVQTQVGATPFSQTSPTAADMGGAIGQAVSQAGQQLGQIAQEQHNMAIELQRQRNATKFNEADTAMSDEVAALTTEFSSLLGNNAADKLPEYQQKLTAIRDKYSKQMGAPEMERAFAERWGHYQNSANRVFGSHAAQQVNDAYVKSLQSKSAAAVDRLIRNSGFGNVAPEYDEIIDSAVELGVTMGWDKATTDMFVQGKASEAVQGIVQAQIDSGNLARAQNIFNAATKANVPGTDVPMLDGTTAARLGHVIRSEIKAQETMARAEASQEAQELMQSSITARMKTGQTMSPENEAKIKAGLTPKQWDAYQSRLKLADAVYAAAGDIGQQSEQEIYRKVEALNPARQPKGEFADPEARLKQDVYDTASAMAKAAIAARKADPSLEAARNYTPVQYALNGWQNNIDDPGHARSFIKRSLAAQEAMGLEATQQKPLPKFMADKISAEIANPNPQQANLAIKKYEAQFGQYWDKVFRQVSPKMDPATLVAATMEDDVARTLLIDASRKPRPELVKLAGIKEADLTTVVVSDPRFTDFRNALSPYGVADNNVSAVRQAVETLALGYMSSMNQDASTAVDNAMKQVLSKYQFGSVNNQSFVAPRDVDPAQIESAAHKLLRNMDVSQFDIPAGVPGETETDRRRRLESSIRNRGRWVTAPGLTGLTLFDDRGMVTRYGRPVTLTWEQILAGAAAQPSPQNTPWGPLRY